MDRATTAVLARLRKGPASTVELQAELYATHAPKQIYDLRVQGYVISRKSLPNRVALYTLISEPDVPVEAGRSLVATRLGAGARGGSIPPTPSPASSRAPVPEFGDLTLLRQMRTARR